MKSDRMEVVSYRITRSSDALDAAKTLAESANWNGVANRLYYSCFYAVSALLLKNDYVAKTHNGTKQLFQKHFIKSGRIDLDASRFYQTVFDIRNEGDYEDFVYFTKEEIEPLIGKAENFVMELRRLIDSD